jgi:hypothetical protein
MPDIHGTRQELVQFIGDQNREIERLRALNNGIIKAWESLPEGDHPIGTIEKWLSETMFPAIDAARRLEQ